MATVGDIAITIGADVGPMVRELGKGKGALKDFGDSGSRIGGVLGSAMGKATVAVGAAAVAVIALTKASMANIDVLSKQARALGISVASFQSMAMVAEEAGVESDKLSKILIKMQDNIASLGAGTKAQVAQFSALGLSMADLAGMGADDQFALIAERLAGMTDPAERTAAALNIFGKSGADAITMFDGYAAAAENAAEFQQKFGIAVSDVDAQNIEAANDAMGRLGMAAQGLGNVLAAALAPAIEGFANGLLGVIEALNGTEAQINSVFDTMERAESILGEEQYNALIKNAGAIKENADTLALLAAAYEPVTDAAMAAAMEIEATVSTLDAWGYEAQSAGLAGIASEMRALAMEFRQGLITAEEFQRGMDALTSQAATLLSQLEATDRAQFGGIISQVGALIGKLKEAAGYAAGLRALLPGGSGAPVGMTEGTPLSGDVSGMMPPSVGGVTSSPRPPGAPAMLGEPEIGGGGGGGGGGGNARIEALIESLKTETEIVAAWYEESLIALQAASDAELEALGGKHEAMERLEEEHQKRLGAIREMGNDWGVEAALAGGAEILGAMGQNNKKALKLSKAFAAAEALVSTYQGAAKELRNGTFGFATAAAVIAKGMGFIAAIKSANEGSTGAGAVGRGSSGGASAASAPAQQATQNLGITFVNDPFGIGERTARAIAVRVNEAQRNGVRLNVSVGT